jgi:plasmid maintenance system antidote protein VapI
MTDSVDDTQAPTSIGSAGGRGVSAYRRRRAIRIATGRWHPWADPAPVRAHVLRLRDQGASYQAIADAAGLGVMTAHNVANRRGRVTAATAAAILAVTDTDLHRARLDAGGTRLRLRALQVMGHSSARVARAIGVREQAIQKITRGDIHTVSAQLHRAVARIYDAWWDKARRSEPGTSGPPPAPPAVGPFAVTGAPGPAWTRTSWTSPDTNRPAAGAQPAAPESPETSPRPRVRTKRRRRSLRPGLVASQRWADAPEADQEAKE